MKHPIYRKRNGVLSTTLAIAYMFCVSVWANVSHAKVESDYKRLCEELETTEWDKAPHPLAIICPAVRFLNVFLLSVGVVFVLIVLASAIKHALSQGDFKAAQASRQTLTTAVIGLVAIIGVWATLVIISNVLGLTGGMLSDPFGDLSTKFSELLEIIGVSDKN